MFATISDGELQQRRVRVVGRQHLSARAKDEPFSKWRSETINVLASIHKRAIGSAVTSVSPRRSLDVCATIAIGGSARAVVALRGRGGLGAGRLRQQAASPLS